MTRRSPGRATRHIITGARLAPPRETITQRPTDGEPVSFAFQYLMVLAALVVVSAVVWAIWGMGLASVVLLVLAVGLVASWIVV